VVENIALTLGSLGETLAIVFCWVALRILRPF
jgi:hypothetical protein